MSQFLFPGTQHFLIRFVRLHLDWNAIRNLESEAFDGCPFYRVISDQPHLSHSEIMQYLSPYTVVTRIHLEHTRDFLIRFDRVSIALIDQAIGVKLIHQAKPATFLSQVQQYAASFRRNQLERPMELPAGIVTH